MHSILSSVLFAGLVSAQFPRQPPFPGRPQSQRPGRQQQNANPSGYQQPDIPMIIPFPEDYDIRVAPNTTWCQVFPVDAGDDYGISCQWGNSTFVSGDDQYTVVNLHAITRSGRGYYDPCNSELPFACKRAVNDDVDPNQINYWPTVNVRGKPCFVTEGNVENEENNSCMKKLPLCDPKWFDTNGQSMPRWRQDLKAYEGWPTDNYVPKDSGQRQDNGPPIPSCYWNQYRGGKGGAPNRPQGGRPQGNQGRPFGGPAQGGRPQNTGGQPWRGGNQGGRPQGGISWSFGNQAQGGRPQNNGAGWRPNYDFDN